MAFTFIQPKGAFTVVSTLVIFLFFLLMSNIYTNISGSFLPASVNFNQIPTEQRILVLTPLKDAATYLDRYFELLDRTSYPNHLISLGFLVSDSSDDTLKRLEAHVVQLQSRWFNRFESIQIFQKDFDLDLPNERRHRYEMQPIRRRVMARSRNWLLSAALNPSTGWVAWVDVDVVEYPESIFEDLMRADKDIIVPNCLLSRKDQEFWAYDKNNWLETEASREIQDGLDSEFVLLEGYSEFPTYRYLVSTRLRECDLNLFFLTYRWLICLQM